MTNIYVKTFGELTAIEQPFAIGKGRTLARLFQAGYPVPDGFVILPDAFDGEELTADAWLQVQAQLERMRVSNQDGAFAVRSSALSEDSTQASLKKIFVARSVEMFMGWQLKTGDQYQSRLTSAQFLPFG